MGRRKQGRESNAVQAPLEAAREAVPAARLGRALGIEGFDLPGNRAAAKWAMALVLVAVGLRLAFWVYTRRYWEDALITCLHSENLVLGFGLTHVRPGEPPLHGFTSPLSVLVPLLGDLMHVGWGVDFIKLVSLLAAAATVLYLVGLGIHGRVRLPLPLTVLVAGYAAVEHHQILYGMAGMETQLAVLAIVASLYHAIAWHPRWLGLCLAFCMLARPDFIFFCAIVGLYGICHNWRQGLIAVAVAIALYAPWLVFTTWYYGSPIPNTIIAKSLGYHSWVEGQPVTLEVLVRGVWMMLSQIISPSLGPSFKGHGNTYYVILWGWGRVSAIGVFMLAVAAVGAGWVLWRRRFALWPLVLAAITYCFYHIFFVANPAGWYMPPVVMMLLLCAALGLASLSSFVASDDLRMKVQWTLCGVYLFLFLSVLPLTFYVEHQIQRYVENGVRKQAGLFLHDQLKPGEAVGCEPLGYMGYYSRGIVYDWPGLNSRKVVAWSASVPREQRSLYNMLMALHPEYLYLREHEAKNFPNPDWLQSNYRPIKQFSVSTEDRARIPWVDMIPDLSFQVFQRAPAPASATPPS